MYYYKAGEEQVSGLNHLFFFLYERLGCVMQTFLSLCFKLVYKKRTTTNKLSNSLNFTWYTLAEREHKVIQSLQYERLSSVSYTIFFLLFVKRSSSTL